VVDWKNKLQIQGEGRKSRKLPTPFVGMKPYGKCQTTRINKCCAIVTAAKSFRLKNHNPQTRLKFHETNIARSSSPWRPDF
jgi:hypothetical protein